MKTPCIAGEMAAFAREVTNDIGRQGPACAPDKRSARLTGSQRSIRLLTRGRQSELFSSQGNSPTMRIEILKEHDHATSRPCSRWDRRVDLRAVARNFLPARGQAKIRARLCKPPGHCHRDQRHLLSDAETREFREMARFDA